jgi:alkylation response protein AidB-like acyl-CoA dehydrogenase
VIVVCRTQLGGGAKGLSLLVVERDMLGFERGRNIEKIGLHSSDTAELFFNDVRVPRTNLLGAEGRGFEYLGFNLAQERLWVAVTGLAAAEAALTWTVDYVKERTAFGQSIAGFQNTKFVLADVSTEIEVTRPFVEQCIMELNEGRLTPAQAARAKLWGSELQNRIIDQCLQLFGDNGYTMEYPIGQAYIDARISPIYAGTNEIMKTIISKDVLS